MEAGPYGSHAAVRRGGQVHPEGGHQPRRRRPRHLHAWRRSSSSSRSSWSTWPCRSAPTPSSPTTQTGIFFALAVSSVSVLGILMAGWASANKYSLMGGLRAAGQLIAYELPDGPRRHRRGHPGRHAEHAGHRGGPERTARSSASTASATRTSSPSSSAFLIFLIAIQAELTQTPVRHADRRVRAGRRLHDRVLAASASCSSSSASSPPPAPSPPWPPRCSSAAGPCPASSARPVADCMNVVGPLVLFTKMLIVLRGSSSGSASPTRGSGRTSCSGSPGSSSSPSP